ncbi:MAG: Gldg family protein [Candidatus Brocadiae bacterium]|nr:Gldg family protein [Candidatus Brocadiia bacterium]
MMNPTLRSALAVLLIGVITLCSIFIASALVGRGRIADLTEHKLYTLSDGTKSLLAKVNQPITLKLYYSRVAARKGPEQIRFWNNYFLYVRDLLDEYVARGNGKLTLEVVDPRPFSDQEEQAIQYGVRRFQLSESEAFFFGMVATTELGKDQVIEFFEPDRQEFVEYDVSKIIGALMQREKKKVGVLANVPILGTDMSPYMRQMLQMQGRSPEPPWAIVEQLRQHYEVAPVKLEAKDTAIPEDIDFLLVVHPKDLDEKTRFAIDQFVMKGGKLIVFVDPHCLADRPQTPMRNQFQAMQQKSSSDLNSLLEAWGVKMAPDTVAVDRTLAVTTQMDRSRRPSKFPAYLRLGDANVSTDVVVTADLHSLRMLFAGALSKVDGAGTEVTMLLETSKAGNTWKPSSPFDLRFPDPDKIRDQVGDGAEPVMLGCLITGKFKTNFPDGIEVPADDKGGDGPPTGPEGEKAAKGKAAPKGAVAPPKAALEAAAPAKKAVVPKAPATKAVAPKAPPKAPAPKAPAAKTPVAKKPAEASKEKPKEEAKKPRVKPITEAAEGAMVMVVADVDVITDMLAYQRTFFGMAQAGDNAPLLLNMIDYLAGSKELIGVRTRGRYSRPFDRVDEIEQEADKATAVEIKALKDKIGKFEKELEQLGGAATKENIKLIQSAALEKRRKLETEIRKANQELRKLQAARREKVEALGASLQTWNMVAAPSIILLIAIVLAIFRWGRAKHYAARRAD